MNPGDIKWTAVAVLAVGAAVGCGLKRDGWGWLLLVACIVSMAPA